MGNTPPHTLTTSEEGEVNKTATKQRAKGFSVLLCKLPQPIRSFFFRTLEHPWTDSGRTAHLPIVNHEVVCHRCGSYRHYTNIARDGSVKWIDGPHPMAVSK